MRFDLFQTMSPKEAEELLADFLRSGREMLRESRIDLATIRLDELAKELAFLASQTQFIGKSPDHSLPRFLLDNPVYRDGLFEIAPESRRLVICAAFLMGEWLVLTYRALRWTTGDMSFATGAMPVVAGFQFKKEMPTLLIAENIFRKLKHQPLSSELFHKSLQRWVDNICLLT